MATCSTCRKNQALDTRWERVRFWLFKFLFPQEYIDLSQDKYTQGFGDGYSTGVKHASLVAQKEAVSEVLKQIEDEGKDTQSN